MPIRSFKDLTVWQQSLELVSEVYRITRQLPKVEQFALANQLQRCAVSIPSNIAEGQQRNNVGEYRQFLGIARGSAGELETQLLIAAHLYMIDTKPQIDQLHQIQKMLRSLSFKLAPKPKT